MLSSKDIHEIKEYEDAGIDVVAIGRKGNLEYSSTGVGGNKYCDQCSAFRLVSDPDPTDWFRDGDMCAVCIEVKGVIQGSLEKPSECINIRKPLWCPKLDRKLDEVQKKDVEEDLIYAQKRLRSLL